ncbi:MAG TPA: DUF4388 domain-containing protein [Thermoanaerobaculia bacterium]|nr:DUF4388 domain-containing protein [Thermoanaerobaculia bacterium]
MTSEQPAFRGPLYQTSLEQTPLPEILVTIHRYKVPGLVECRRDEEIKKIHLDRGRIIFASTNQLRESLGDKLLREGHITREQYAASIAMKKKTGKRHGVTLVEMRLIDPQVLANAVREQILEIVWSIFGWTTGQVSFSPGRDKSVEFVKVEVSVADAIMGGVRNMPDVKALVSRLGPKTTIFAKTGEQPEALTLGSDERHLLDQIDGRRSFYDLVSTPPLKAADNVRILYGLYALKMIAPKEPKGVKVQIRTGASSA